MSLKTLIARLGTNMQFVAFNAHWGVTYAAVSIAHFFGANAQAFGLAIMLAAAVKEFWFDARYEIPAQDLRDNFEDWLGYVFGGLLAGVFV